MYHKNNTGSSLNLCRSNTDVCIEAVQSLKEKRSKGEKVAIIGEANHNMPFQHQLLDQAKKAGKISMDYQIPEEYRFNTPQKIATLLKPYQEHGVFLNFPFGTDLTADDIALGGALKTLKALSKGHPLKMVKGLLLEFFKPIPKSAHNHIKRMNLLNPFSLKDKIMRKTVVFALRNNHELQDSAYLQTPIPNRVVDK